MHCNTCFRRQSQIKLWLTSCGHLTCPDCYLDAVKNPTKVCPLCKKKCQALEISRTMRPDMLDLFRDPKEYVGELVKKLQLTMEFQVSKSNLKDTLQEYEVCKIRQEETKQKLVRMEEERRRLKQLLEHREMIRIKKKKYKLKQLEKEADIFPAADETTQAPDLESLFSESFSNDLSESDTSSEIATSTPLFTVNQSQRVKHLREMFSGGQHLPSPIIGHSKFDAERSPSDFLFATSTPLRPFSNDPF
ncbi:unnamed protein product [Caenorhabditis auriculariae]|uniref:RING-type domain-containing protein n=1 Tax=Caenorhabditis auriculariae TaxID=2777116 RepID=A0A8S1HNR3_9PELO|nr:unnamed protein product [Caenorhabditis auriculariae]